MASNAGDVLDNIEIHKDLCKAIGNCNYIVGATARQRDIPIEIINPKILKKMSINSTKLSRHFTYENFKENILSIYKYSAK